MSDMNLEFMGYRRPDGRVGIRNHVLIVPCTICAADVARMIASKVEGTVCLNNQNGCGQVKGDLAITVRTLAGYAAHPNVFGVLLVGLGCEQLQAEKLREEILSREQKPLKTVVIQQQGGIGRTVKEGVALAQELVRQAGLVKRQPCRLSDIVLGTQCGGSDPTSGLSSNLVVGNVSDRMADLGGTSVISETPEFVGAEHVLARQAATPELGERIIGIVSDFEKTLASVGQSLREGNPSPGNIRSGITTLEEKSLGCIHKAGTRPIQAVYGPGERVTHKGVVVMDTVAYDVVSVGDMVVGGSQVTVFTTGLGNPVGSPVAPVIKVTGNRQTYLHNEDFIDFDTSATITHEKTVSELGGELLALIRDVCEGRLVKAEEWGMTDIAINHLCTYD